MKAIFWRFVFFKRLFLQLWIENSIFDPIKCVEIKPEPAKSSQNLIINRFSFHLLIRRKFHFWKSLLQTWNHELFNGFSVHDWLSPLYDFHFFPGIKGKWIYGTLIAVLCKYCEISGKIGLDFDMAKVEMSQGMVN